MAANFLKRGRRKGHKEAVLQLQVDDAIQEGWAETLEKAKSKSFDRNHPRAEAYLMTAVIWLYDSVLFSQKRFPNQEWDWKRNSAAADYARLRREGRDPMQNKRILNGGSISVKTNLSLNTKLRSDSTKELGDIKGIAKPSPRYSLAEKLVSLREVFEDAKQVLDEKRFQIFNLRYNYMLTYKEIAKELGISRQRVCGLLRGTAKRPKGIIQILGLENRDYLCVRKRNEERGPPLFPDI